MHAVVGAGFRLDHDAKDGVGGDNFRAFSRDQVTVAALGVEKNQGLFDLRILAERSGITAGQFLPSLLLGKRRRWRFLDVSRGLLLGKVGRVVLVLGADGGLGLHVGVGLAGLAVLRVGQSPEDASDGVGGVPLRKLAGRNAGVAVLVVSVIESGSADAHADVGGAVTGMSGREDATLRAKYDQRLPVGHVVAGEVGRGILLGELELAAMQFLLHGCEQEIVGRGEWLLGVQRFLAKDGKQRQEDDD